MGVFYDWMIRVSFQKRLSEFSYIYPLKSKIHNFTSSIRI